MESIQKYCAIDKTVLGSGPCSDERLPSLVVASEIVSPIITGLVTDTRHVSCPTLVLLTDSGRFYNAAAMLQARLAFLSTAPLP